MIRTIINETCKDREGNDYRLFGTKTGGLSFRSMMVTVAVAVEKYLVSFWFCAVITRR